MNPARVAFAISTFLFFGMLACLEVGYRIGRRVAAKGGISAHEGVGTIEAAVFALLGLLLAFTYANGMSHLDQRRELIIREANAISTAYLRVDLLPASQQPEMRQRFREYLDTRLQVYAKLPDQAAAEREMAHAAQLQQEIWADAIAARPGDPTGDVPACFFPRSMT